MRKINIIGAGPAGLYTAGMIKRKMPETELNVYEKLSREDAQENAKLAAERMGLENLGFVGEP